MNNPGKNKCEILKAIRKEIAKNNRINLQIHHCEFEGVCLGSCPACDEELNYLTEQMKSLNVLDANYRISEALCEKINCFSQSK